MCTTRVGIISKANKLGLMLKEAYMEKLFDFYIYFNMRCTFPKASLSSLILIKLIHSRLVIDGDIWSSSQCRQCKRSFVIIICVWSSWQTKWNFDPKQSNLTNTSCMIVDFNFSTPDQMTVSKSLAVWGISLCLFPMLIGQLRLIVFLQESIIQELLMNGQIMPRLLMWPRGAPGRSRKSFFFCF